MTRPEQEEFVKLLFSKVLIDVLRVLPRVPEEWDGHELRQLVANHFEREAYVSRCRPGSTSERARAYRNECLVRNLV